MARNGCLTCISILPIWAHRPSAAVTFEGGVVGTAESGALRGGVLCASPPPHPHQPQSRNRSRSGVG
eukprot:scaffold9336_cov133-Isochrysis_galbana.AAC.5